MKLNGTRGYMKHVRSHAVEPSAFAPARRSCWMFSVVNCNEIADSLFPGSYWQRVTLDLKGTLFCLGLYSHFWSFSLVVQLMRC